MRYASPWQTSLATCVLTAAFICGCSEKVDSPNEFIQLGRLKERQDNLPAAIKAYSQALELDPENAETWYDRGVAYIQTQQPGKAIDDYTKAIDLDPGFSIAWNNRAAALASIGEYHAAIRDCTQAIELDPADVLAWRNRGIAYHDLGQLEPAIANLKQAAGLDPIDSIAHLSLANAYLDSGELEPAIDHFTTAIRLDEQLSEAWLHRAIALQRLGQSEAAQQDLQRAVQLGASAGTDELAELRVGPIPPCVSKRLLEMGFQREGTRWKDSAGNSVRVVAKPIDANGSVRFNQTELSMAHGKRNVLVVFAPTDPQAVLKVVEQWQPEPANMKPVEFLLDVDE